MKRISLFIAALALGLFATTAATCQKTPPTGPTGTDGGSGGIVSGVINCAEQGVHNAAIHIIDDVASALATGDYVSGLVALVKQFGEGAVDCAVSEVGKTSTAHASMNQLEADKAKRAKAWLDSRNVTFSQAEAPHTDHVAGICIGPGNWIVYNQQYGTGAQTTGRTVLAEGYEGRAKRVLELDRRTVARVRADYVGREERQMSDCVACVMDACPRNDSGRDGRSASLRQSGLRESAAPLPWYGHGEHRGQGEAWASTEGRSTSCSRSANAATRDVRGEREAYGGTRGSIASEVRCGGIGALIGIGDRG